MKNEALTSKRRLAQIISILHKHQITRGIDPVKLREIIEDLGPTFVKIGQLMSSRQDMFSKRYCDELMKLRTQVAPMDTDTVRSILESEYGCRAEEVFLRFDPQALGSASIAQVHRAVLLGGEEVVIKVQRPHIYERMERDISLLRRASRLLNLSDIFSSVIDINVLLDEFWETAKQEMDFINEANFMQRFARLNEGVRYIAVPKVRKDISTSRVLVMEHIAGYGIDEYESLAAEGYDRREIAAKLADNYMKQIIHDGFFHADPHVGNLRIRDGKIVWLDFGMMGQLNDRDRELIRRAFSAMARNDISELTEVILTLGIHDGTYDYNRLYDDMEKLMGAYMTKDLQEIDLGSAVQEIFTIAHRHHISMPKGISMLARGLVSAESTIALLDPTTNIITTAINYMGDGGLDPQQLQDSVKKLSRSTLDSLHKTVRIPSQLSQTLHLINKGRLKVNLEVMDSFQPIYLIDKLVNKLIMCIVAAALLIGSSLICTTDMTPRIFGIPALGFIGYIAAVLIGIWMLFHTHVKR